MRGSEAAPQSQRTPFFSFLFLSFLFFSFLSRRTLFEKVEEARGGLRVMRAVVAGRRRGRRFDRSDRQIAARRLFCRCRPGRVAAAAAAAARCGPPCGGRDHLAGRPQVELRGRAAHAREGVGLAQGAGAEAKVGVVQEGPLDCGHA